MTHEELISQLKDIHLAPPPSWWPPAPGYYLVVLAVMIFCGVLWLALRLRRRLRLRKSILNELKLIEEQFLMQRDTAHLQAEISALFRRIAIYVGKDDLHRSIDLDDMARILKPVMPDSVRLSKIVELLTKERFHKEPQIDGVLLIGLSREQIKRCRI